MSPLAAAAVHAIRPSPLPLLLESLDGGRASELFREDSHRRLDEADRALRAWIGEGAAIVAQVRDECRAARERGTEIDLAPAIAVVEERIAQDTAFLKQARRKFDRLVKQAGEVSAADAALVRQVAAAALDFLARQIDALSDQGLAYRALQAEFGPAATGEVYEVSEPAELERLFRRASSR
jgi:hypothetical protein